MYVERRGDACSGACLRRPAAQTAMCRLCPGPLRKRQPLIRYVVELSISRLEKVRSYTEVPQNLNQLKVRARVPLATPERPRMIPRIK